MLPDLGTITAALQRQGMALLVGYGRVSGLPVLVDGRWEVTIICPFDDGSEAMGTITGVPPAVAEAVTNRYLLCGPFFVAFALRATDESYTSDLTGENFRLLTGRIGHGAKCGHKIGPEITW